MTRLMDEMYRWNDMKEMKYKLQLTRGINKDFQKYLT